MGNGPKPFDKKRSGQFSTARYAAELDDRALPRSGAELAQLVGDEARCLAMLAQLRWRYGRQCPLCRAGSDVEILAAGEIHCHSCGARSSAIRGTALDNLPGPITTSLAALWHLFETRATPAVLARTLGVSDPRFLWPWLDEVRRVMDHAESVPLRGVVEVATIPVEVSAVDERGRAYGAHVMVAIAAELRDRDLGHVRVQRLTRVDQVAMTRFVRRTIAPGSAVRTGSWRGYQRLRTLGYRHHACYGADENCEGNLYLAERLASLLRLWLWSVSGLQEHDLDHHLADFSYRWGCQVRMHVVPSSDPRIPGRTGMMFRDFLQCALACGSDARTSARSA